MRFFNTFSNIVNGLMKEYNDATGGELIYLSKFNNQYVFSSVVIV